MSKSAVIESLRQRGCQAWQAEFAAAFLQSDSPFHLLTAPPGTGKMYTAIAIMAELVASGAQRILILAPASLCEAWENNLSEVQPQLFGIRVDRQMYRELEAQVPVGESPWSTKRAYVISNALAVSTDVAASLAAVNWDLVIVDEAQHLNSPSRGALMEHLLSARAANRLLLLSSLPLSALQPQPARRFYYAQNLVVSSWFNVLKDWDDKPVAQLQARWQSVPYRRANDEVEFLSLFEEMLPRLRTASGNQILVRFLEERAASSLFAVEQSLLHLKYILRKRVDEAVLDPLNPAVHYDGASPAKDGGDPVDAEMEDTMPNTTFVWADESSGQTIVQGCLESLEHVATDAKLDALKDLLRSLVDVPSSAVQRICILSAWADTVSYLHSAIDVGLVTFTITASTPVSDRGEILKQFLNDGGLLIASDAGVVERTDLRDVIHVIHYDLPYNDLVLVQRHGRFDRFGRWVPFTAYVLRDESGVIPNEIQRIDQAFAGRDSMQATKE